MQGFNRFLQQLLTSAKQWLFFMLYLSFFRFAFLLFFRNRMEPTSGLSEALFTALYGLRYDSMVATIWVLLPFLLRILPGFLKLDRVAGRVRTAFGAIFVIATAVAWVITFAYFKEYNEQFNHFVFNLYYDDTKAIFQTIWADYHPVLGLLAIGLVSAPALVLHKRLLGTVSFASGMTADRNYPLPSKIALVLFLVILLVAGMRGSFGSRPAQRKDAAISRDAFLNKAVVNPFFSLHYALQDHRKMTGLAGLETFLPDRDVRKAAQELFQDPASYDDLDAYLLKRARGPKTVPPRHIFLVVMESYDAWPFIPKYASLGLTTNLSELGRKGVYIDAFVPASDGTMQSLTAIMTGLPYTHVEINYQRTALKPYPSSLFETFKRLGYRTRLFYGGYLSWQRFGDFVLAQGAEEVYGAPHMNKGVMTHEWGIDDEYLFEFIAGKVDDVQPSFNLVMTTSYHPPYNVDVWAKGFPLKTAPPDLAPYCDNTTSMKMLGHLWYADKCLGDFVTRAEAKLTRPLFAFTGDHYGRKFINANPEFFERSGVPLILYGKEVLRGVKTPPGVAGSHIDIGPTLVELAAPAGFTYYSMGQDLLFPRKKYLGLGWFRIIGKDFIFDAYGPPRFYPLPGKDLPGNLPDIEDMKRLHNRAYGIGWWRVKQGAKL
jgi:phosphoglycerol transferase MdoB-like AlkP superfamily enzyme